MSTSALRRRYLATLGLSSGLAAACTGSGPATPEPTATAVGTETSTVTMTAPATSETVAPIGTSVASVTASSAAPTATASVATLPRAYWTPFEPKVTSTVPKVVAPLPSCPHGEFCIAEADAKGDTMAAAPFGKCAVSVDDPTRAGGAGPSKRADFAAELTKRERANTTHKGACCYSWVIPCPGGRPLLVDGMPRLAPAKEIASNHRVVSKQEAQLSACFARLSPEHRAFLAEHYTREARYEHASVAAFSRVSLSLLAHGAPGELVAETHRAAIDEVAHAERMFLIASAALGYEIGPGSLDLAGALGGGTSLADLASEALREGAFGELAAAMVLREEAAVAPEPVRALVSATADDEERHVELAWRTVAWALERGGNAVREQLLADRAAIFREVSELSRGAVERPTWVLDTGDRHDIRRRAGLEVVLPCLDALLAASPPGMA